MLIGKPCLDDFIAFPVTVRTKVAKLVQTPPSENLKEFFRGCEEELGLDPSKQQIFIADDLQSTSRRLSWVPSSTSATKTDREKLKSIVTTIYWIAEAAAQLPSYSGPKLDTYAFESVIFGIYSPREEPKPDSKHQEENGTDSVFEEEDNTNSFLDIPDKIEYKEPAWKSALKALQIEDSEAPVKTSPGIDTESAPSWENRGTYNGGGDEVAANGERTLSSDDVDPVVLRQPSAVRLRRMERKLGKKGGPPTSAKPHGRTMSLPETSNAMILRQNALDSNHNSATYEDIDDDEEDSSLWRNSFKSWKMKRNEVASNVLERKAFREEVDTLEQNKGKKKPKTFREIVEEKQRRENLLAKKSLKKELEKDEIQAILTSVDLVPSDSEEEEEPKPEIQVETRQEQQSHLEPVQELKEGADFADNDDHHFHTSSSSPTATTPSEEAYPSMSFHEKMLRERERERERAEAAKASQEVARKPKPKRMSMGIMGRIAAFNSGDAFKRKGGDNDEEAEGSSTTSSAKPAQPAQEPASFSEHVITMQRRPRAAGGFGFIVSGGIDKKKPIVVKGIDPGSTAGLSALKIGDEITVINNERTKTFDHDDIQYSISQAVLSGHLMLKVKRYDHDSNQLRSVSTSSSASSSYPDSIRRDEQEEERRREEERKRREEEKREDEQRREEQRRREEERREEEKRRRIEEQRKEEERQREEERWKEEERRMEEERWREEEEERMRELEEDMKRQRQEEQRRQEEEERAHVASSRNVLSKARQLLDDLGDEETSSEETPRHERERAYINGNSKMSPSNSWTESDDKGTRDDDNLSQDDRLEEEIMNQLQLEEKEEDEREEVHRRIEDDERDKSPTKEVFITAEVRKTEESAPFTSSFMAKKPAGFRSVQAPRPYVAKNKGPEPYRPQPAPSLTTTKQEDDIRERVKKERSDFFPDEDSSQVDDNMENLWRKVERPQESAPPQEKSGGVQRRMKKSDVDPANRRSFNVDEERQRLEKWQKEQERIRQEQYEQEQRRLQEEQEKDLLRAEYESRRKQDMEQRALQERRRMLQKKAQEDLKKREEEMLEKERKERERRRLEQLAREEEEERRRKEEERLQQEREERERIEREQREREEAARRREEELMLVQRRKEEEKRAQEKERQRIREEREARERKAREKIEREKEEYERLLKEREEERERLAREQEERQRAAQEREARQRAAKEEEEKRAAKEREERQRAAKEREARLKAALEQEERVHSQRPFAGEVIKPQVQQRQESAPPPSRHHHQPDEELLQKIREEERERIRLEERDRLRREWEQLEQEKHEQLERQRKEREEIERLKREQAELKREREKLAQQQQEELDRLAKQRELYSKSLNNVFDDEDVEKKNSYNRRKQHGSEEDLRKPQPSKSLEKEIMEGKMLPERDPLTAKSYMAKHRDDNIPTEQHWLVEEAKRRQHGPLVTGKTINSLPIHPRKDSLDHEPVLEKKVYNQEHAAPPPSSSNHNNANLYEKDYVKNEPVGYEQEIPTRIPPPNRSQGSLPRTKQPTHSHKEPSPNSETNRWDAPRHKYDSQPEFKHVQRRMHGAQGDKELKQKMHNRRSMPDLTQGQAFEAPVARIMDDQRISRGPGGGPAPRSVGPPSPHHEQQRGPPPSQHGGPGGDQRRPGPAPGPDSLIQPHDRRRAGPQSPPAQMRANRGPPSSSSSPQGRGPPRQQQPQQPHPQRPPPQHAPGRGPAGPRASAFQQPSKKPLPGRSVSGKVQCSNCGKSLGRGAAMIIESVGLHFHLECFRCCVCNIQLGNGTKGTDVRIRANKLHCQNCYSNDAGFEFTEV